MEKVKLLDGRITLIRGDCLEIMPRMKAGIIDMILCDLPYGTTRNKWDSVLPLDKLWIEYKRLRKSNAATVLTAQTPFDKVLGVSNLNELKYEWIWNKTNPTGHLNANSAPMKEHENVLVFYQSPPTYNKQMVKLDVPKTVKRGIRNAGPNNYNKFNDASVSIYTEQNPRTIIKFSSEKGKHPTQKPVALMEYLIKTYTNENDLILDNTMGSGTTAIACINTNRRFVGMEKEQNYFDICVQRCNEAIAEMENKLVA